MKEMYYTYVLFSKDENKFYIGYTINLERRIDEHKSGSVHTTYRFTEPRLIFYEAFVSQNDAERRERYFKTTKGRKALRLMLRDSLK